MFDMIHTGDGSGNYTLPLRTNIDNLDAEDDAEAERVADEIIAGADDVNPERTGT